MQLIIKLLFSPMVFAIGFLWPLITQILQATSIVPSVNLAWIIGAFLAILLGSMAQFRGSWIWIK